MNSTKVCVFSWLQPDRTCKTQLQKGKMQARHMDYQTARQCATLSQEIYADLDTLTFSEWPGMKPYCIDNKGTDTQLAILEDPARSLAVLIFRGSNAGRDWQLNFKFGKQRWNWLSTQEKAFKRDLHHVTGQMRGSVASKKDLIYPAIYGRSRRNVKMHRGFVEAYLSVRSQIHAHLQKSSATNIRITGHSLGGALAKLCAVDVQYNFSDRLNHLEVYTFGAPKPGNRAFVASYNERVPHTWRVVYGRDLVASLPRWWQGYRHVNTNLALERDFSWRFLSAKVNDHRMDNYVQALETLAQREMVPPPVGHWVQRQA